MLVPSWIPDLVDSITWPGAAFCVQGYIFSVFYVNICVLCVFCGCVFVMCVLCICVFFLCCLFYVLWFCVFVFFLSSLVSLCLFSPKRIYPEKPTSQNCGNIHHLHCPHHTHTHIHTQIKVQSELISAHTLKTV